MRQCDAFHARARGSYNTRVGDVSWDQDMSTFFFTILRFPAATQNSGLRVYNISPTKHIALYNCVYRAPLLLDSTYVSRQVRDVFCATVLIKRY